MLEKITLTQGSLIPLIEVDSRYSGYLLFRIAEHVQRLSKGQITHDVKCSEVEHSHHVDRFSRILFNAFLELRNKLISVLHEKRLLLLESAVRKRRREYLALAVVIDVTGLYKVRRSIHGLAVTKPVFVRHRARGAFRAVTIYLKTSASGLYLLDVELLG
jgi:hypothetical protein